MRSAIPLGLSAALLLAPDGASQTAVGWAVDSVYAPPVANSAGKVRRLSSGELITWDGVRVTRESADGGSQAVLFQLPDSDWAGILAIDPTESFAIAGRGTGIGELYRVDLISGGGTYLLDLVFNYDANFSPEGWLGISAPSDVGGFNGIHRFDPATLGLTEIVRVPGPSGPLDFDAVGNLYYAPATMTFPSPPDSQAIDLYLASDLAALAPGEVLLEDDALTIGFGFDGAGSLLVDEATGAVYIAENNFGTGVNRIVQVIASPAFSPVLYEGAVGQTIALEDLRPAAGGAAFGPFQPAAGGSLTFSRTDFIAPGARFDLHPARPTISLTGPGTTGIGPFEFDVDGALPGGAMWVLIAPAAAAVPEIPLAGFTPPLLLGLDPVALNVLPFPIVADANGEVDFGLFNSTGAVGTVAVQLLLVDSGGAAMATTNAAIW